MKLSIVIPAHNEEKRIGKTLEEYGRFFKDLKNKKIPKKPTNKQEDFFDFEILVVINKTTDKTEEVVKKYCKEYKEIRYLKFEPGGKGFAIREGFKEALKRDFDLIGFVDADIATPPNSFYDLIKNINNSDGIIASRWLKGSIVTKWSLLRKITSAGFNFFTRALFLMPYSDTQCGAKIFKKETIRTILDELSLTEWAFDVNLLYLCKRKGFKIKEYPTIWESKENSKITDILRTSIQMILGVVRLRLIYSPLNIIVRFYDKIPESLKIHKKWN